MWPLVFLLCFIQGFGVQGARWEIIIHTSDKEGAGTDSDIFLTLHGSRGSSAEINLGNTYNNYNNYFERNQEDRFFVTTDDIGEVCSLTIRSADFGSGKNNAEVLVRLLVIKENWKSEGNLSRCPMLQAAVKILSFLPSLLSWTLWQKKFSGHHSLEENNHPSISEFYLLQKTYQLEATRLHMLTLKLTDL
ncbi:uncharacterized protein LOC112569493 [Pomacea canaliculata]|uniref:uncharacterized protein LOC112569493 n=1 Tax=Pomacea canaliculata TaxID=400727 RepID=UPI000D729713|nr:uncharacterized protein LOC112569493 [Pomacea canaliculata]